MTKKKKDDKKTTDAPAPAQTRDENTPAPAAAAPPEDEKEEIWDDTVPPPDPTVQLMEIAFEAWAQKQLSGVFYVMTRTFAHHRQNEKYGTHLIFNALQTLNGGKHAELLEQLAAFRDTLFKELDEYIADRDAKR